MPDAMTEIFRVTPLNYDVTFFKGTTAYLTRNKLDKSDKFFHYTILFMFFLTTQKEQN